MVGAGGGAPVLVVGAGPVGLTAACELARQGARVRLVDAAPEPTTQSRAVTVHARTQEHLAAMGVLDELAARAVAITAVEVRSGAAGTLRLRASTAGIDSRYPRALDAPQPVTEHVLAELAARLGVVVERGVELTDLSQDAGGVDVALSSGAGTGRERFAWVVGADGGHSRVRAAVGERIEGVFHGEHFLFADVAARTTLSPDTIRLFAGPDGVSGAFPMPDGRTRFLVQVPAPGPGAEPTLDQTQRLVDDRMGEHWRLSDPRWLVWFEVHHGQVERYRRGRVLLAGDAAHVHSPAGGQGMNTGMQDAVNLAWKLALVSTGRAGEELLDSYHAERRPVGAAVVRQTTRLTHAVASAGARAHLRDVGLLLLGHLPAVGEAVASSLAEVRVRYRGSPAVGGGAGVRGACPGDHAPDPAGLTDAAGAETWVGDLLRRPGHLLLTTCLSRTSHERLRAVLGGLGTVVPVVPRADGVPGPVLVDPGGHVADRYGIGHDGAALVRPDGYLGYLAARTDPDAVADHLATREHVRFARGA
ncbi:FAD-dependent oxidoreductase [Cellulomonas pakistanensis]|uniref:Oxygenase n=1 Tax=Cellulomonas pakistanensis TaxID=992287 RepID=A0A919PBN5_9CELL|nr:FAD-dependent oxidoreductase [Cellulomonas pakistanensis]GIG36706.1 oxygenase [Cellulomonas pakistanensis]